MNYREIMIIAYGDKDIKDGIEITSCNGFGLNELNKINEVLKSEKWLNQHRGLALILKVGKVIVGRELEYSFDIVEEINTDDLLKAVNNEEGWN